MAKNKSRPRRAVVVEDSDDDSKSKKGKPKSKSKSTSKKKGENSGDSLSVSVLKTKGLRLTMSYSEYKGSVYLDFREFYKTPDGEWKPTKKGVSINALKSVKVLRRLGKLMKQAEESEIQTSEEES